MKFQAITIFAGLVGCGVVLQASAHGIAKAKEKVLYSFCSQQNCPDGEQPEATLVDVKGTLYGETRWGGNSNSNCSGGSCGTLFSIDPKTGSQKVLYLFCSQPNCSDGATPTGGLISMSGLLYGTTRWGGANGGGTVFSLDPKTGNEQVVYSFCSVDYPYCADGYYPVTMLTGVKGILFGATYFGGITSSCPVGATTGCGTLFSLDPKAGTLTTLYSFCSQQNCVDGEIPWTTVLDVNGTLYGDYYGRWYQLPRRWRLRHCVFFRYQ